MPVRLFRECYVQRSGKAAGRHGSEWLACSRHATRTNEPPTLWQSDNVHGDESPTIARSSLRFASTLFTNLGRTEAGVGVRVLGWLLAP